MEIYLKGAEGDKVYS